MQLARGQVPSKFVYHLTVRAAPEDPDLGAGASNAIAAEVMHRTGILPPAEKARRIKRASQSEPS